MKFHVMLLVGLLIMGCTSQPEPSPDVVRTNSANVDHQDHDKDHLGCQEGEVVDGECIVAKNGEKNVELFGQDFSNSVIAQDIKTDTVQGFVAQPIAEGQYPGVVMIHEWWGLNDNIKEMAQLLAHEGYVVFAVDLYEGEVGGTSDEARALATAVRENPESAIQHMRDVVAYLKTLDAVDDTSIGSMGWCFGGQQSLNLALSGEDMQATVIYYGRVTDDQEQLSQINWPVLGIFGEEDTGIPPESVRAFESSLNELGVENSIHIYPGVGHAFANPSGARYAPEETIDAWEKTVEFLDTSLKN